MSRVDKGVKVEIERESSHKVDTIREDEYPVLDLPTSAVSDGDKSPGEATDGETTEDKAEGDRAEEGEKAKEDSNKERKIWMEYTDFCISFRSENLGFSHSQNQTKWFLLFCVWLKPKCDHSDEGTISCGTVYSIRCAR